MTMNVCTKMKDLQIVTFRRVQKFPAVANCKKSSENFYTQLIYEYFRTMEISYILVYKSTNTLI